MNGAKNRKPRNIHIQEGRRAETLALFDKDGQRRTCLQDVGRHEVAKERRLHGLDKRI